MKEIKMTFSDKTKAADANFMIEFEVLAMKANTDELHAIFLLKKNI